MKYRDVTKEKIVAAIKALGYNSRQVSVRSDSAYYVTVRDPEVDADAVEDAVQKYESYQRDERTQEILCGGNTFIFVRIDDRVLDAWAAPYYELIKAAIAKLPEGSGRQIEGIPGYFILQDAHNKYFLHLSYHGDESRFSDTLGHQFGLESYRGMGVAIHQHKVKLAKEKKKNEIAVGIPDGQGGYLATAVIDNEAGTITQTGGAVELVQYSRRAIAVFGDTKPIKDILSGLGGSFNYYLKRGDKVAPGWIFPNKKEEEVTKALGLHFGDKTKNIDQPATPLMKIA